ncbi:uncharacterized protein LOC113324319 [Papaver somniferum]|uniref:uncharacterized protein LOC113324319 n=1 Tax=Papaver somniferum TaxID=3469 RepID=UPI000E6F98DC|nr:uncharacterized protein LOC113324319 [Papaver somniferum]
MYRSLFLKIMHKICEVDLDFRQRKDAARIPGHSPHMKMYAVKKCICKVIPPDSIEDYICMASSTIYYYIKKFCDAIMFGFNAEYMRRSTVNDIKWSMKENAARGFPGMLGSLDCMHWGWRVCPMDGAGTHTGHKSYSTCVLEAFASYDRWFWHGYLGVGGSSNDLNVFKSSNLFDDNLNEDEHRDPEWNYVPNPPHAHIVGYLRQTSESLQNPVLHERLRTDLAAHI